MCLCCDVTLSVLKGADYYYYHNFLQGKQSVERQIFFPRANFFTKLFSFFPFRNSNISQNQDVLASGGNFEVKFVLYGID